MQAIPILMLFVGALSTCCAAVVAISGGYNSITNALLLMLGGMFFVAVGYVVDQVHRAESNRSQT